MTMDWIEVYRKYGAKGLVRELAGAVLCAGLAIALIAGAAVAFVEISGILWR